MSDPALTADTDAETVAKRFRGYVLKPAEGVFLFHPRAIERLVAEHLGRGGYAGSIPDLAYYVMPRAAFLTGLEDENPEALAVIEGLELPSQIVLLPIPPEQRLDDNGFNRLLRDYWGRRFEAEIARAWQRERDERQDSSCFGPEALRERIGEAAFAEIREVLTHDGIVPDGIAEELLCRAFVAQVARLRYFFPGARGFFFPAIRDWAGLDDWLRASGLELPPSGSGYPPPRLLARTRPRQDSGYPVVKPLLPVDLGYGLSDPDLPAAAGAAPERMSGADPEPERSQPPSAACSWESERGAAAAPAAGAAMAGGASIAGEETTVAATVEARCLESLAQGFRLSRQSGRRSARELILKLLAPLLALLLALPVLAPRRRARAAPSGFWLELHLILFRQALGQARRAESADRHGAAILHLARARERFRILNESCGTQTQSEPVRGILLQRSESVQDTLTQLLAAKWKLSPETGAGLKALVERLSADLADSPRAREPRLLLQNLEQVLLESRATYFQLQPLAWLLSMGRRPLRQILPFQARLRALRLLDMALARVEHLGWSIADAERLARPLRALSVRLSAHLENDLTPHLRRSLHEAGFTPATHRERVAANKMLGELLDVIQRRRHLKFTDVRDIVARNILRLPDPSVDELLRGDRLAHFDRVAALALPGVYKPGEFYIKGLQQLSAPIFGTARGRLVLRHLLLPLGLAYLGLKTLDLILGLFVDPGTFIELASLWPLVGMAILLNALFYTRLGRGTALALWRAAWWALRLLLFDGLRRLLRWPPVARLLATGLVRGLDRRLLQPLLIGMAVILPVWGLGYFVEPLALDLNPWLFVAAFAVGTLAHNTPAGRRIVDNALGTLTLAFQRLNQALVIGLVQELLNFFKEVVRRFEQGLHWIEELLSHHLGESRPALLLKALLAPIWKLLEAVIQFYVTVLVEPQINPIKHFPLVTVAHKLMLPFLPAITSFLVAVTDPFMPRLLSYPFVTFTVLMLPGLAGFLVWELKENWRLYAANHSRLADKTRDGVEPAIVGIHGETMRGMMRRGFHSGTLPKAFDRLRRALRAQMRDELPNPRRLREARRRLEEIERALETFCDRELAYALRLRCADPDCRLERVETMRPRLASGSFDLTLVLMTRAPDGGSSDAARADDPMRLHLLFQRREPELSLQVRMLGGAPEALGEDCRRRIREDLEVFGGRAGVTQLQL